MKEAYSENCQMVLRRIDKLSSPDDNLLALCALCGLCEQVSGFRSNSTESYDQAVDLVRIRRCPLPEEMPDELGVEAAVEVESGST